VAVPPAEAVAAVKRWIPAGYRATLLAIAGAESGWRLDALGDYPRNFTEPVRSEILPWTCPPNDEDAPSVFGPWQIQGSWRGALGFNDNCGFAAWLMASWDNSAHAAAVVLKSSGLGSWTTYTDGAYLNYMADAAQALGVSSSSAARLARRVPPAPRIVFPVPATPYPSTPDLTPILLAAAVIGGLLVVL